MKLVRYICISVCLFFISSLVHSQKITDTILNGPDAYFRTYNDFLVRNYVPFQNAKIINADKGKPFAIWFWVGKQKEVFGAEDLWGFRWGGQLYRVRPDGGLLRIIAIGELIMYTDPYYEAYVDSVTRQFVYDRIARNYYSKTLTSSFSIRPDPFITTENQDYEFFKCEAPNDLCGCFMRSMNLDFVLTFIGDKKYKYKLVTQKAHPVNTD